MIKTNVIQDCYIASYFKNTIIIKLLLKKRIFRISKMDFQIYFSDKPYNNFNIISSLSSNEIIFEIKDIFNFDIFKDDIYIYTKKFPKFSIFYDRSPIDFNIALAKTRYIINSSFDDDKLEITSNFNIPFSLNISFDLDVKLETTSNEKILTISSDYFSIQAELSRTLSLDANDILNISIFENTVLIKGEVLNILKITSIDFLYIEFTDFLQTFENFPCFIDYNSSGLYICPPSDYGDSWSVLSQDFSNKDVKILVDTSALTRVYGGDFKTFLSDLYVEEDSLNFTENTTIVLKNLSVNTLYIKLKNPYNIELKDSNFENVLII